MQKQLEYAYSVWSPHYGKDIYKKSNLPSAEQQDGPLVIIDKSSSVTEMLRDLRWRPLDQRRIDTHLVMKYKITYDLVAIPVSEYLTPNLRQSKFIHSLAYRQIFSSTNYYMYSFSGMLYPPTLLCTPLLHCLVMLSASWCMYPLNG